MQELITKILDLFRELLPMVIGWFGAKQDSKIDDLKNKVETIEKFEKIDNIEVKKEDLYNEDKWK